MSSSTNKNKRTVTELLSEFRPGDIVKSKSVPEITGTIKRFEFARHGGDKTIIVESGDKIFGLKAEDVELVAKHTTPNPKPLFYWLVVKIVRDSAGSYFTPERSIKAYRMCSIAEKLTKEALISKHCTLSEPSMQALLEHKRIRVVETANLKHYQAWRIVTGEEDQLDFDCDTSHDDKKE